ncbi:hypothetical protein NSPZN2_10489 [Nitrospira defluvii]|uniref:Uncharacterized protein n=1 Tax=Nitrospira defluvii TaxID=330214 RepID=A0ABM8QHA9_9BACT|nr:hypothetical protein NSPZN2_10489 [Nitrospira defluvii]
MQCFCALHYDCHGLGLTGSFDFTVQVRLTDFFVLCYTRHRFEVRSTRTFLSVSGTQFSTQAK